MALTLGQVIASDAAARSTANKRAGQLHRDCQKHDLFSGFTRTYEPFDAPNDDGTGPVRLPPESKRVQLSADDVLRRLARELTPAIDWAAAKDIANCGARADVIAGGEVLLRDVPATHLLHLEKVFDDIVTFIGKLPVLPADEEWTRDEDRGLWKTGGTTAIRNEQEPVPVVLYEATEQHPAQVQLVPKQVPRGTWTSVKFSGALSPSRKRELEERALELRAALRRAREEANRVSAEPADEGSVIFGYLLG